MGFQIPDNESFNKAVVKFSETPPFGDYMISRLGTFKLSDGEAKAWRFIGLADCDDLVRFMGTTECDTEYVRVKIVEISMDSAFGFPVMCRQVATERIYKHGRGPSHY